MQCSTQAGGAVQRSTAALKASHRQHSLRTCTRSCRLGQPCCSSSMGWLSCAVLCGAWMRPCNLSRRANCAHATPPVTQGSHSYRHGVLLYSLPVPPPPLCRSQRGDVVPATGGKGKVNRPFAFHPALCGSRHRLVQRSSGKVRHAHLTGAVLNRQSAAYAFDRLKCK